MYSFYIAQICYDYEVRFTYYTSKLPSHLKAKPEGNLKYALDLGMQILECEPDVLQTHAQNIAKKASNHHKCNTSEWFIPMGAALPDAAIGVKQLADDINTFVNGKMVF